MPYDSEGFVVGEARALPNEAPVLSLRARLIFILGAAMVSWALFIALGYGVWMALTRVF